jgi:hypothetical protein
VHRDTTMKITNKMQVYRLIYYSKSDLHVSGDVFDNHQEHLTVFIWYHYKNHQKDALYRLVYYSKSDQHVSGDVFDNYQEHLTVFIRYHYKIIRKMHYID